MGQSSLTAKTGLCVCKCWASPRSAVTAKTGLAYPPPMSDGWMSGDWMGDASHTASVIMGSVKTELGG
jgi:hypothetical protein